MTADGAREYDVIIAGYGPTGATLAGLLGMRGIHALVLEREDTVWPLPRAGTCDDEALRIWQSLGIADTLMREFLPQERILFVDSREREFFRLERPTGFGFGWNPLCMTYQPLIERVIRERVARLPSIEVRLGHAVESFDDSEGGVTVHARERQSGDAFSARARYLIACDGGKSAIRTQLGVEFPGTTYQQWLVVDGAVADPSKLPQHMIYHCDPRRPTCTFPQALRHHRWQFMLRAGETREQMETDEIAEQLLAPWSGLTGIELIRHAVYIYHSRIATRWKTGRVLLAGDAAHVMPPFGGQGMNSGVRDAGSLAWRLALVIRGRADPAILETYETERRPHVRHMVTMSVVFATILTTRNRPLAFARDLFFRTLRHTPKIGRFFRRGDFKPMSTYPRGFMTGGRRRGRHAAAGTMIAQPMVTSGSGQRVRFDDLLGAEWSVVAMDTDPRAVVDLETALMWEGLPARFVRVVPAGASRSDAGGAETVEDGDGELGEWFARHRVNLAVVRPDKIVFGACDARRDGAPSELARALRSALNAPVERLPSGGRRLSTGVMRQPTAG